MLSGSISPTGIPMPFISVGGTSLMIFMGAIGILCNIGKNSEDSKGLDYESSKSWKIGFKKREKVKFRKIKK